MRRRTAIVLVLGAACAWGAPPAAPAGGPIFIAPKANVVDGHAGQVVARLGKWGLVRGSLAEAIRAYGRPDVCSARAPSSVTALWRGIGLTASFYTLSTLPPGRTGCTYPQGIYLGRATLRGPRWRTSQGLRVGAPAGDIRDAHPTARRHGSSWWIYQNWNIFGVDPAYTPALTADIRRGKVASFTATVAAGGE
jgi:hypothetical protein